MTAPDFLREESSSGLAGVAVGIVTDNADPEGLGRVKLTFPWRDADDESYWARVATLMTGGERGTYFLPEVDDEVLVAFENGDIHYPYVIGSLWNGVDPPPQENSGGENNIRQIRSRAGHELVFDDAAGGGGITLTTSGGQTVSLSDEGDPAIAVADASGNTVEIATDGSITVSSTSTVSVEATELSLKGTASVTIESTGPLTLSGTPIKLN